MCAISGGPLENLSVYVQGGIGSPSPLQYRLYATVGGFVTLVAQSQVQGSNVGTLLEWQNVSTGAANSLVIDAAGTTYTVTVQDLVPKLPRSPVLVTIAGVNTFDTAPDGNFGTVANATPGQEVFLPSFTGYAQLIDVAIDQRNLPPVLVTVYANCGAGSVQAVVDKVQLSGIDKTVSAVFQDLKLPPAVNYLVSMTNQSQVNVSVVLTGGTHSIAATTGGSVILNGDVTGPSASNTVIKWRNVSLDPATMSAPADTQLPVFDSATASWRAVTLSGGASVDHNGVVTLNTGTQTIAGDVTGDLAASTVVAWRGKSLDAATMSAPADTQLPVFDSATNSWRSVALSGGVMIDHNGVATLSTGGQSIAGDVTGTLAASTVGKVNGATVPVSGALTTGNTLQVSGASALAYGPLNLAGGVNYVTGDLPASNIAPGSNTQVLTTTGGVAVWATPAAAGITALTADVLATGPGSAAATVVAWRGQSLDAATMGAPTDAQFPVWNSTSAKWFAVTMSGDATISDVAAITVAKIHGASVPVAGALTTGNVLQVSGASALAYGPLNLAGGANYVTGLLPVADLAPGSNTQILTTTGGVAVWGAAPTAGITALTGDVTASGSGSVVATVVAINGTSVPATPGTNDILQATSSTTAVFTDPYSSPQSLPFSNYQTHKVRWLNGEALSYSASTPSSGEHYSGWSTLQFTNSTTAPSATTTTRLGSTKRLRYQTGGSSASNVYGGVFESGYINAGVAQWGAWRGNAANRGGFFYRTRFAITSIGVNTILNGFVGLAEGNAISTVNSGSFNWTTDTTSSKVGIGFNCTTSAGGAFPTANWQAIESAHSAPHLTDLGSGFALTLNDFIEVIMYAAPNDTKVTVTVNNLTSGATNTVTLNTNLPPNTTFMYYNAQLGLNTSTSGNIALDLSLVYAEHYDG